MTDNKAFQKRTRNISTVSDISEILDPLKREDGLDVKVIFLLKSRSDCSNLFNVIKDLLISNRGDNGTDVVTNASIINTLAWEETFDSNKNTPSPKPSLDSRWSAPDAYSNYSKLKANADIVEENPSEFYFRFSIGGQVFRLRLVYKGIRNVLKETCYDFLTVCVAVKAPMGNSYLELETEIREFEWQWVENNCQKKPTILLGYCLGNEEEKQYGGHEECLEFFCDALNKVNKLKLDKKKICAIPKFCTFTPSSVGHISQLFNDMKKLLLDPGYFLQQCALVNDLFHFKVILRSPSCTDQVLNYTNNNLDRDNPVMIAAKLRHKHLLSFVLLNSRFDKREENYWNLDSFLHSKNKHGQTLLHMVSIQGSELEEQKLLLLRKEIELHCQSDMTHEADQLALKRCMRSQLKSSEAAATILSQLDYLQGIPWTEYERKMAKCRVWSSLLFSTLLLSLGFSVLDYGTDGLITYRYFEEAWGDKIQKTALNTAQIDQLKHVDDCCRNWPVGCYTSAFKEIHCKSAKEMKILRMGKKWMAINRKSKNKILWCGDTLPGYCAISAESCISAWNNGQKVPFQCFPASLDPGLRFAYTLLFICLPMPLFLYEFFTSRHYQIILKRNISVMEELVSCRGFKSMMFCYSKLIIYALCFICCIVLWPIVVHFIKFYNDGKWYLSRNRQREKREKKREHSEVLWNTARMMEVSFEASFQPTIQLYLLFPTLFKTFQGEVFTLKLFEIKGGDLSTFKYNQTVSIVTSIISLSYGFLSYHSVLKRGAFDQNLTSLFYKAILYLAILFQILSRLFIFVIFAFSFGPGKYHPLLIFMLFHCILMMIFHFIFSDAKEYLNKGGLAFFHYVIGNGAANMYIHNWIRMDPFLLKWKNPKQHISTFCRQFAFDLIFLIENCILLAISLNSFKQIDELKDAQLPYFFVLFGFYFVGMILKCVYYRYIHMWAWLIMDYTTVKEDGHWFCVLPANMFFCGNLKENYKITLCCLPKHILSFLVIFFGNRKFECTGTSCSLCTAVISVFLFPIAVVIALGGLIVVIVLFLAFMPIFLIVILPCFFIYKRKKCPDNIIDNSVQMEEHTDEQNITDETVNMENLADDEHSAV